MKKKRSVVAILVLVFILFISWPLLTNQYDKQNKFYLFVKELIPQNIKESIKNNFLSELRSKYFEIKNNRIIEKKKSQGYQGLLISEKKVKSEDLGRKYLIKEFFLPFKRLDLTYGWRALENSKRAHYLDIIDDSHDVVALYMILMNHEVGKYLSSHKSGIYRDVKYVDTDLESLKVSNTLRKFLNIYNNIEANYKLYELDIEHQLIGEGLDYYTQVTSPIDV